MIVEVSVHGECQRLTVGSSAPSAPSMNIRSWRSTLRLLRVPRSPLQKTLTQVYKVKKSSLPLAESKSKPGNAQLQQAGVEVCRLTALVAVKPEPVEIHGSLISESQAPLLHQESTTCTQTPVLGVAPSLQKVKQELLSPSSCATESVSSEPGLPVASKPLLALPDKASPAVTTLVMTQESKPKAGNAELQQSGVEVCRLPALVVVKPEPEDCDGSLIPETQAPLLHQESLTFTQSPVLGAAPSLQKVKLELLSPSSCVTNGTEGVASSSVESLATAHANGCISLPPASVSEQPDLVVASKPLQALPDKVAPLVTTSVMTQELLPKHPSFTTTRVKPEPAESTEDLASAVNVVGVQDLVSPTATFTNTAAGRDLVKKEVLTLPPETNRRGVFTQPAAAAPESSESEDESESEEDSEEENVEETQTRRSQNGECKFRNSKPGFRIQGGRVYDSEFGITCHWCRQKTVEHHVKCRKCTIHFCGPCLLNRNGENVRDELCEGVQWLCPKCRQGCGRGCHNCCNCGPCRKALGFPPTGKLIEQARNVGFGNVHDYLIHLETGESAARIARRKRGRGWTNEGRFKRNETSKTFDSDDDGASSSSYDSDEFTLNEETSSQLHQGLLHMKFVRKFVKSQKRKGVATQAPFLAKKNRVEVRPDVHRFVPRMRGSQPSLGKVTSASQSVAQKLKTTERSTEVSQLRTMSYERENVECKNNGSGLNTSVKRRKFTGDKRPAALNEDLSSRSSLPSPVSCKAEPISAHVELISTNVDTPGAQGGSSLFSESEVLSKASRARAVNNGVSISSSPTMSEQQQQQQRAMECPTDSQGTDFRMKLKAALAQSFDAKELEELDCSVRCRKPVLKLRHMRGRVVDVVTEDEGQSYLDYHQDFAAKLEVAESPPEKLALLRGLFFWLQHSCMEGAFRPWSRALAKSEYQSVDCMETEGPDCQVTAVVLQLDEANQVKPVLNRTLIERPSEMTLLPLGSHPSKQNVIPFPAKKISSQPEKPKMRSQMQPAVPFQVVLGLPAPTQGMT